MTARRVVLVVAVGLLVGVLTQLGQGLLPDGWQQVANAISPWLLVAFVLGATMPDVRWAAGAGVAALVFALVGYYGLVQLRFGYGGSTNALLLWTTGAFVGGSVYGVLGRWWRVGGPWQRAAAIGFLAAVAIAEGVYLTRILPTPAVGAGFIVAGLVIPLLAGRSWVDRMRGYAAAVPALGLGALGYLALDVFASLLARLG